VTALAVLLWAAVVARAALLRRDRRQQLLWSSLLTSALAVTLSLPAAHSGRDVPVVGHLCGVVSAALLLRLISAVTGRGRAARQWAVTAAVLAFLTVAGWHGVPSSPARLDAGITPLQTAYWAVLEGYLVVVMALACWACATVRRAAPPGALRGGLLAMGLGSLLMAGYALGKLTLVLVRGAGTPVDFAAWDPLLDALRSIGLVLFIAGGAAPPIARLRSALHAYRSLLVLRPLWSAVRQAFPDVVLMQPARSALVFPGVAGARLRVYRRVIEIRDGMLALRDHLPAGPGVPADEDPATTEARAIAEALQRHARGEPPAEPNGTWAPVGPEMADEVAWLSRVSVAFRALRRADDAPTPRPAGSPR
jgi:hypothetical protein